MMFRPTRFSPRSPARSLAFAAPLLASLAAGCAAPLPYPAVPPPRAETVPPPPVSAEALSWQPGHWDWAGSAYVWTPGRYVPAAGHGRAWMPGYWAQTPGGYVWQAPHWV